jgi:outer membrane biogenesis lipoprotein LolB
MSAFLLASALAALAGCSLFASRQPPVANAPPPGISFRFTSEVSEVEAKAVEYCNKYGRVAKLAKVEPAGSEKIAHFSCE